MSMETPSPKSSHLFVFLLVGVLLFLAASRTFRLTELDVNPDEVWAVWQTFGTPTDILRWTPYDWPPGYFLTLGSWRVLTGEQTVTLRFLGTLGFMLGASGLYRAIKRLRGRNAGLLAMLTYGALSYGVLLTIELRGYSLLFSLFPLTFWAMLRYFDNPNWRRALPLAFGMAGMFYLSLSSFGAFLMMGLYTLIAYPRRIWRWWLPGILAGLLALPEIINKAGVVAARTATTATVVLPPLPQALLHYYQDVAGNGLLIWIGLFLLAAVLIAIYERPLRRVTAALLLWAFGGPVLMYFLNPVLGFFGARYSWWIMLGIGIFAAWGLGYLPRIGVGVAVAGLVALLALPVPFSVYNAFGPRPLEANLTWLREHMLPGDALIRNPNAQCGTPEEWDYHVRAIFPNGLQFATDAGNFRRIWYINDDTRPEDDLYRSVRENRIAKEFVGPAGCLFRLYEAPPDVVGVPFENGMRFHGVDVIERGQPWSDPIVRREGESIWVRLWWSVDRPPELDYSINVHLRSEGGHAIGSSDSAPQLIYPVDAPVETSRWQPDQFYIEERQLTLPYPMSSSEVNLYLAVYFWEDGVRVSAPNVDETTSLWLRTITVRAW